MARAFTNARVWYGGLDLSGSLNAIALEGAADLLDETSLIDAFRKRTTGLRTSRAQLEGMLAATAEPDSALSAAVGSAGSLPLSIASSSTEGDTAYTFLTKVGSYVPGGSVGELHRFSFGAEGNGALIRGVLAANRIITVNFCSAGSNLGAVANGQRFYAALHVLSVSPSDTLQTFIESDDDGTWGVGTTSRLAFTDTTVISSQFASVAGPITDPWWRICFVPVGTDTSFSVAVVFGIV